MKAVSNGIAISLLALVMLAGVSKPAGALYLEEEAIEGGGGGGGGGSTSTPSCAIQGTANQFMTAGQGQCSKPAGELSTVYIHGFWFSVMYGAPTWDGQAVGKNVRYLAWESFESPNSSRNQTAFKANLDLWCKGASNPCELVCHSFGCIATGLLLAQNPGRWNVLKVTAVQGVHGGTNVAAIAASLTAGIRAGIWVLEKIGVKLPDLLRAVGGNAVLDMIPTNARGLYNHDSATPWKTLSTNFKIKKKKCKWWNLPCHVLNFGIGVLNGVLRSIHGFGNNDILVPVASSGSSRSSYNTGMTAPCSFTRWTGHSHIVKYHGSSGCTVGPNISHMDNASVLKSAEINTFSSVNAVEVGIGGTAVDCTLLEDQCNSENSSNTSTYYLSDSKPNFSSNYGYKNLLNSAEVNAYVAAGGGDLATNYLPYSESTSSTGSTGGGGGGGGGSGSSYY